MSDEVLILLLAVALDLILGEPPNLLHPVVWMGRWIGWGEWHAPVSRPLGAFIYGLGIVLLGLYSVALLASLLSLMLKEIHTLTYLVGSAWLLKTSFAYRALVRAAADVREALCSGNLVEARRRLSWHLVSRDTSQLDASLVSAATIESVAENFSDGIVAPLFYFALFGLPGALAYRFANTADAMLGYHDTRHEYLGKFAAWLDDVLCWVPARIAAFLLLAAAALVRADVANGWRILWRDHARTASPNAGWPMSAMAGILGVKLEKVGHYRLGDGSAELDAHTIVRSLRIMRIASVVHVLWLVLGLQART